MKKRSCRVLLVLICAIIIAGVAVVRTNNPRLRLLFSVINFSEHTLSDPGYILYGIDFKELCRDYFNGDLHAEGEVSMYHMEKMKSTMNSKMVFDKSFENKTFVCNTDMDLLWFKMGELNFYGEDETVYLKAPLLGDDIGYAFPTGMNLFPKMPDMNSDISKEWFHDNTVNIVNFMNDIEITETGNTITDEASGKECDELFVLIPKGTGDFLWELMGMDPPEYDCRVYMYLTKNNHTARMTIDLSEQSEGAYIQLDGLSMGKLTMHFELPENEIFESVMIRNPEHTSWIDCDSHYYANNGVDYNTSCYMTWENLDDGFSMKIRDVKMMQDGELKGEAMLRGRATKVNYDGDLLKDDRDDLHSLEVLDWRKVRDDAESFANEVLEKTSLSSLLDSK